MHRISNAVRLLLLLIALGAFPAGAAPLQAQWEFRLLPGDAQGAAHPGLQQWRAATVPAAGLIRAAFGDDVVCAQLEQLYTEMVAP